MNDQRLETRLLRAVIGLSGPVEPIATDFNEWLALARTHRLLPMFCRVVRNAQPPLPQQYLDKVAEIEIDVMSAMVRFEHDVLEILDALDRADISTVVLKGVATAHLDYADPSLRQFGDVDLLVAPTDRSGAIAALARRGWIQAYSLPRNHEQFTHAVTLRNDRRVEVDLHQRIAHRALGLLIPTEDLLKAADSSFDLAGRTCTALCREDRLIHAAVHSIASRGEYRRLSSVADVLVLADATRGQANPVLDRAGGWQMRGIVEAAIVAAYDTVESPVPPEWLRAMTPVERRGMASVVERVYLSDKRRPVLEEFVYLRLMHGWRDRRSYLGGYFSPRPGAREGMSGWFDRIRYLTGKLRSD